QALPVPHDGKQQNRRGKSARQGSAHYFCLISTLSRAGLFIVTVIACRCSPRSGWRNTISCGPILTGRLPIGVSPTLSPSIQTSAHGIALIAIVPFGKSTFTGATLPAAT